MSAGLFNALQGANRSSGVLEGLMHPNVLNPAAALQAGAQAAGSLYDVRQKQSQQALGQIYQQSVDQNGNFDPIRFRTLLSQTPLAAQSAREGMESAQQLQTGAYNLNAAQLGLINNVVSSALLETDPTKMKTSVLNGAQRLVDTGAIPQSLMNSYLLHLDPNPANLRSQLEGIRQQTLPSDQATQMIYGRPIDINQGTQVTGGTQNVRTGALTPSGAPVPVWADPATQGQPVHWTGTDGTEHYGTWAGYNIERNNGRVTGPATPVPGGVTGPATTNAPSPTNQPRLNPQDQKPQPQPQPTGPTSTPGPPPGTVGVAEKSAQDYAQARSDAGGFQARVWPLVQASHILDQYGPTTGQGADAARAVLGHLQTLANIFTPADIQSLGQAKFEEAGKYMQQAVNAMPFAGSSNDKLAAAISGSPNTHMSNLANQDVLKAMIGLERMKLAAFTDFEDSGLAPNQWATFQAKWARTHDPRAFMTDMLDDDKLKTMFGRMSPTERSAYQQTLNLVGKHPEIMNRAVMP